MDARLPPLPSPFCLASPPPLPPPPLAPPPFAPPAPFALPSFLSSAIPQSSSACDGNRVAALRRNTFLRAVLVGAVTHTRRFTALWIDQHHVRVMHRRLALD